MAFQSQPLLSWICAQASIISCGLLVAGTSQALEERPSLSAACQAWKSHISDLLDQHRTANELDDAQIGDIIRLFYEAQSICSAQRFEEGLAIYEAIPIGQVASRPLR